MSQMHFPKTFPLSPAGLEAAESIPSGSAGSIISLYRAYHVSLTSQYIATHRPYRLVSEGSQKVTETIIRKTKHYIELQNTFINVFF